MGLSFRVGYPEDPEQIALQAMIQNRKIHLSAIYISQIGAAVLTVALVAFSILGFCVGNRTVGFLAAFASFTAGYHTYEAIGRQEMKAARMATSFDDVLECSKGMQGASFAFGVLVAIICGLAISHLVTLASSLSQAELAFSITRVTIFGTSSLLLLLTSCLHLYAFKKQQP